MTVTRVPKKLLAARAAQLYCRACVRRSGNPHLRLSDSARKYAEEVVEGLDYRLLDLFVEAQFDAMPSDWCMRVFKRPYPPPQVAFSDEARRRYDEYVERGQRVPAW